MQTYAKLFSFFGFNAVTNPHGLPQQEAGCIIEAAASMQRCREEQGSSHMGGIPFLLHSPANPSPVCSSLCQPSAFPCLSHARVAKVWLVLQYLILELPSSASRAAARPRHLNLGSPSPGHPTAGTPVYG